MRKIFSMWKSIVSNHVEPWPNIVLWQRLPQYVNWPWSTIVSHVYFIIYNIYHRVYIPWFIIIILGFIIGFSQYENQPWSAMANNHLHIVKNIVSWSNVTLWQPWSNIALLQRLCWYQNQPWSSMFTLEFIIFILGFIYLGFIIIIPWVYIIPLGL